MSCFGCSEVNREPVLRHWLTENVSTVPCSSLFWILPLSTWADQHFKMDTSEVTIAEISKFADAVGLLTKAEKEGGMVYESGWVTKKGWNWRTPYGVPSPPDEPAVHITFDEASAFCRWKKSTCQAA